MWVMAASGMRRLIYKNDQDIEFARLIHLQAKQYFDRTKSGRYADRKVAFKTVVMIGLYVVPYLLVVSGSVEHLWAYYMLMIVMGIGVAILAIAVCHEANHGTYSNRQWINKLLGSVMDLIGGNSTTWKIQHNILHHSTPNVEGYDEDIDPGTLLRFSPHSRKYWFHKYQHIYAWILYGFSTLNRIFIKEIKELISFSKAGFLQRKKSIISAISVMIFAKAFYVFYILVLPVWTTPFGWKQILVGFLLMHLVAGIIMSFTAQLGHIMEDVDFPQPNDKGVMEGSWWRHQLSTTCNFSNNNKFISWIMGGANFQIEHHLFPRVSHVHYPGLARIIEKAAVESNMPYHHYSSLFEALCAHGRMLKRLASSSVLARQGM